MWWALILLLVDFKLDCCEQVEAQFEKTTTEVEAAEESTLSSISSLYCYLCICWMLLFLLIIVTKYTVSRKKEPTVF